MGNKTLKSNSFAKKEKKDHRNARAQNGLDQLLEKKGDYRAAKQIQNRHLAVLDVFVCFIYKMTLLGKIVGGSKLTPYDSNCSKSLCVCV